MTSDHFYEIAKIIPEEAWPDKVKRIGKLWTVDTLPVPLESVIQLFVGSMTEWLLDNGSLYLVPVFHVPNSPDGRGFQLLGSDRAYKHLWSESGTYLKGITLVEALADACHRVKISS